MRKKSIMRSVFYVILAMLVGLVISLRCETMRLRNQVVQFQEERRREAVAALDPEYVGVSEDEKIKTTGIYGDIARAYSNCNIMAMRTAMLKLPQVNNHLSWQVSPEIEHPFYSAFSKAFLLAGKLSDFDSPEQFAKYVYANIEAALFFGELYAKRKTFKHSSDVECLTLERLKQYEAKFDKEGKSEMKDIATKALLFWIAWIESPNGFTRQYARWLVASNFEYARLVKPEFALTRENAMKGAYTCAKLFLSKSGYTPSWLSEFQVKENKDATTSGSAGK